MNDTTNQIRNTSVEVRKLSAVVAEVWVKAVVDRVASTTELRGRLLGPRCPGVSTVEIAYPFLPLRRAGDLPTNTLGARVVIDEPNLWTEQTPFVYEGALELWEEGRECARVPISVGLKLA